MDHYPHPLPSSSYDYEMRGGEDYRRYPGRAAPLVVRRDNLDIRHILSKLTGVMISDLPTAIPLIHLMPPQEVMRLFYTYQNNRSSDIIISLSIRGWIFSVKLSRSDLKLYHYDHFMSCFDETKRIIADAGMRSSKVSGIMTGIMTVDEALKQQETSPSNKRVITLQIQKEVSIDSNLLKRKQLTLK